MGSRSEIEFRIRFNQYAEVFEKNTNLEQNVEAQVGEYTMVASKFAFKLDG